MAAFRLFGRPLPIHFALLGQKRKYIKSKTTAKLREKRTSIAAVRAKLGQFDTFLTPLLSHCRLPLKPSLCKVELGKSSGDNTCLQTFCVQRSRRQSSSDTYLKPFVCKVELSVNPLVIILVLKPSVPQRLFITALQ